MNIVFILLPLTIMLASFFVFMFIKMARAGQYDDLDTPAYRILMDDDYIQIGKSAPPVD